MGLIIVLALMGGTAMSASDDTAVTVRVDYVDCLQVQSAQGLRLIISTPNPSGYAEDSKTATDGFRYTHNSTAGKKITAVAVKNGGNSANSITLKVAVEGGTGMQTLVTEGVDEVGGKVVWTNIAAGCYNKDLTWTAIMAAGTKPGNNLTKDYVWIVTFTSADAD